MFESLVKLSAVIPNLLGGSTATRKRRASSSRNCFIAIEDLEMRQLLSAANASSAENFTPRIINGAVTTDFSAVGSLTFTPTGGAAVQSTGTLISTQWVLTSASASKGLTEAGGSATVVLGGVPYVVDDIVVYPKYNASSVEYQQDIALWHLTTAVPGTIVPMVISSTPAAAKNTVTLVGFGGIGNGTTGSDGSYGNKHTTTTKVDRVSPTLLSWKLDNNSEGTTAGGDRGGPVLKLVSGSYQIVGVSSGHSTTTSKIGDLAYNTRADLYAGWIDDTLVRAHATVTTADDYVNTADTVAATNRTFTFNATKLKSEISAKFHDYADVDVFKIVTAVSGLMTIDLNSQSPTTQFLDTTLELLDSDGVTVLVTSDDIAASNLGSTITKYLAAGTYFVRVSGYANHQKGAYRLTMNASFDNVGNTLATAKTLTPNSIGTITTNASINVPGDDDWFKFTANKSGRFQFDFEHTAPGNFDPMIDVYTAGGVLLAHDDDAGNGLDARVTLNGIVSGTTYYVRLNGYNATHTGHGKLTIRKIA